MSNVLKRILGNSNSDTETTKQNVTGKQARRVLQAVFTEEDCLALYLDDGDAATEIRFDEWLEDPVTASCYLNATASQLEEVQELPQFEDPSFDTRKAIQFAKRFNDTTTTCIEVQYNQQGNPGLIIEFRSVAAQGDLSNELVKAFAQDLSRSIHARFDPMAENHSDPVIKYQV